MVEPTRIAVVDMGSNAIRFMIAEFDNQQPRIVASHRRPVRIGDAVFRRGFVPDHAVSDIVDAFRSFGATCDQQGVGIRRVIATSAMREANNRDAVVEFVQKTSGFEIEVISGEREARLLKVGVETKLDLSLGRSVLVDVGGGSAEIVVVDDGAVASARSYRLGALRMLEQFRDAGADCFVPQLKQHLENLAGRLSESFADAAVDRCVAVGGNIDSLSDLVCAQVGRRSAADADACRTEDLHQEIEALAALSVPERIDRHSLHPDRADTIVPAGMVYVHMARLAGAERVLTPRAGVKEGLLDAVAREHGLCDAPSGRGSRGDNRRSASPARDVCADTGGQSATSRSPSEERDQVESEFKLRAYDDVTALAVDAALDDIQVAYTRRPTVRHTDTYLDDASGSLARRGVGLRLRDGGANRVLTCKLRGTVEGSMHRRREVEASWQSSKLPERTEQLPRSLRDVIEPLVGDRELRARLQLSVVRELRMLASDGDDICELAIDTVSARAGDRRVAFQEIELEVLRHPKENGRIAASLQTRLPVDFATNDKPTHAAATLGL